MLTVSLSQIQMFRECQQKYAYAYFYGIQKRESEAPLELGTVMHRYLATYYHYLSSQKIRADGVTACHEHALEDTMQEWEPKLEAMAQLAYELGSEESGVWLAGLAATARYLMERYFVVHGREDSELYTFLRIEERLLVKLARGIQSVGVADLVLRENSSGITYLCEHKTHKSIPSTGYRLRDLQTVLYAEKLKALGQNVEGVMWNYIRTAAPAIPERLKNGTFTRRAIDSTWDCYEKAVRAGGEDPLDYGDVREKLLGKESEVWFPRYSYILRGDHGTLLRDYVTTAREIAQKRKDWSKGAQPVRNLTWSCDRCTFGKLCTAEIAFGGVDDVMKLHYTTKEQRKGA